MTNNDTLSTMYATETEPDAETTEQTTETEQDTPTETVEPTQDSETAQGADAGLMRRISAAVDRAAARTAYERGVKTYAKELTERLAETVAHAIKVGEPSPLRSRGAVNAALLGGADDWTRYSYGGRSLIHDGDVAKRLCTPSELRSKRGGELPPNREETWLDVQARALNWAARGILRAYDILANLDDERIADILADIDYKISHSYGRSKRRVTAKYIRDAYKSGRCMVYVGYCEAQCLLGVIDPELYTTGIYGWNYDVYSIAGLYICTGYRGMVGNRAVYVGEYEQKAHEATSGDERRRILAEWIAVNLDMLKADVEGARA